jgi:ABC-2 type transport system permease protein
VSIEPFMVTESADSASAAANVVNGETDVVVTVDSTSVHVRYNQTNFDTNRFAIAAIDQVVDEANLQAAGVTEPAVTVETTPVAGEDVTYYDFLLPGLVAMGLMNASIGGMAVAISRFREQKILRRILATPLDPNRFLAAQVGARLVLALVQAALILGIGVFVFGATIHGNVVWLFVLAVIGNLIFLNIGFSIAGRARNPDAADGMANAIALPMLFLSGTFFPTDTLPEAVQTIVAILPLTPLLEAMRIVAVDGDPITAASSQIVLLAGWVVVSFAIASRLFRFQEV